jgi:hypothetical protein
VTKERLTWAAMFATLTIGGCTTTTVLHPPAWPEGVEVLATPPTTAPIAVIETNASGGAFGGGTMTSCREEMTAKAKELGATAIYISSETRTSAFYLEIFEATEASCRAFAYVAVSHDAAVPAPVVPPAQPSPAPATTAKPRR